MRIVTSTTGASGANASQHTVALSGPVVDDPNTAGVGSATQLDWPGLELSQGDTYAVVYCRGLGDGCDSDAEFNIEVTESARAHGYISS